MKKSSKKIFNLISSIVSLTLSMLLLVTTLFAWYCTNTQAEVDGVTGSIMDNKYSATLERGTYDSVKGWTWTETNSLELSNVNPGNKFYFRIKLFGENLTEATAKFDNVSSSLISSNLAVKDGKVGLSYNGSFTPLYDVEENKVTVNSKTLYNVSGTNTLTLDDYRIENVFYFYDLGDGINSGASSSTSVGPYSNSDYYMDGGNKKEAFFKNVYITKFEEGESYYTRVGNEYTLATSYDSTKDYFQISNPTAIKNAVYDFELKANKPYHYFALEFNEAASLETINNVNCSNCYMLQKLIVSHISISGR